MTDSRWRSKALGVRRRIRHHLHARRNVQPPADPTAATDPVDRRIIEASLPHTMTGIARLQALIDATRYCVRREIPGAFVECGVWRGGSVLAMLLTLQELAFTDRDVHLYDTFEGMTEPTNADFSTSEGHARATWEEARARGDRPWSEVFGSEAFDEETVKATLASSGYPSERLHLVKGPVEVTVPEAAPEEIALLRLDTDWYESTRHELIHLYPRLSVGGVLIIDDYGHWAGCRRAVDEYFAEHEAPPLLTRIDYTGRLAVKL